MLHKWFPSLRRTAQLNLSSTRLLRSFTTTDGPFSSKTVHLEPTDLASPSTFATHLTTSVQQWTADATKAVWLHLNGVEDTAVLSSALEAGFLYHHARDQEIVLCQWLDQHIPNKIPPFATHQVGCAGVVTRLHQQRQQVLLIREPRSYEKWKLPGGIADPGEEFGAAAEREVYEETGVQAQFQTVMCMRNSHGLQFGKSDLYVVSHLIATEEKESSSEGDSVHTIDPNEIDEAKWFDVEEWKTFTTHPINLEVIAQLTGGAEGQEWCGKIEEVHTQLSKDKPMFRLYVPRRRGSNNAARRSFSTRAFSTASLDEQTKATLASAKALEARPTLFDKILDKSIPSDCVYETSDVYCFRDIAPQAPTHVLCIPKERDGLTGIRRAEERHEAILGKLLVAARKVADMEELGEGYRVVINDGVQGCQSVYHLHVHVLGGRQLDWPPG